MINIRSIKNKPLAIIYIAVLLVFIAGAMQSSPQYVDVFAMPATGRVVIIDAGHGSWDPGKVIGDDILEKDINLAIALKLQRYLEQGGSYVLMTRVDDTVLGDTKRADMAGRVTIINEGQGDLLVSIHQNSFPDASASGPQVFYYGNSEESKRLAESVQSQMTEFLSARRRSVKANENYVMLKRTNIPAIIVECGFLSNYADREKLITESYQQRVAWAIYVGIVNFLNNVE
ncbi:MAG: N-acetylmuramoyl-L-alanine amidase [Defluviitaleaceae bacterium]|nr:N-acetylmuramoyl-L-alanine amidase [Defluviitaleaceae bacterium]